MFIMLLAKRIKTNALICTLFLSLSLLKLSMKAVILAAGEGTRMRPFTYSRPKALVQVAGKPILSHILAACKKAGVTQVCIVVRHLEEQIRSYVKEESQGLSITCVSQGKENGTAAALLAASNFLDDDTLVLAGDGLVDSSVLTQLIESHKKGITCGLTEVKNPSAYGVAIVKNELIERFEEKPAHPKSNLANTAMYVFDAESAQRAKQVKKSPRGEFEMTDLLVGARAVTIKGMWFDVGNSWNLFEANELLLKSMKAKTAGKVENCRIDGKLIIEKGATIVDSTIEGMVYVGADTHIGPHSFLKGATSIGKNCAIGDSTSIKNSILFDHVNAKHLSYIGDSVIGSNVNFGAGTQIANYRFDSGQISAQTEKGLIPTGRNKLGCFVGDNVKFGVLSCTFPGISIGDNAWIGPGTVVSKNVERNTHVYVKQTLQVDRV